MTGRILAAAVAVLAACAWAADERPAWTPSAMDGLDPAGWSAPAEEGGVRYRAARASKTAVLTVPAWWGSSFRPPEGTVYILHVRYKDTATQPVVALAHAGVARYWGLSELHRFGGTADGQWKTAQVPVSWDLICRKARTDVTEIAFRGNVDLPIASIEVRPAQADSAEQYFRETREWIARVQADKRKLAAASGPSARPELPETLRKMPVLPFAWDWQLPLWQHAVPQPDQIAKSPTIRMARNQYASAAFGVYGNRLPAGGDVREVTVDVTPPANLMGQKLACEVTLHVAEYSAVQATVDYSATQDSGKYRMYPQRLWPAHPVQVTAGQSQMFWVTVRTLGEASAPGTYRGKIRVVSRSPATQPGKSDDLSCEWPLTLLVEVLPVTLLSMEECGLSHSNCATGLPTLQEVHTLVEHNHNGMDIWFRGSAPDMRIEGGKLKLDWTYLDDWMTNARRLGLTHIVWFFGGDPAGFPDTLALERDLYLAPATSPARRDELRREFIRKCNESPDKVLPELRPLYADFVRQLVLHAREKDWPRLVLQPFDEPGKYASSQRFANAFEKTIGAGPWIETHFRDSCQLIREGAAAATATGASTTAAPTTTASAPAGEPFVRTALEAHVVKPCLAFLKDVDIFCTNRARTEPGLADKLRSAGVTLWQYSNCDDQAPAHRTRYSYGFYFASFGSRGSLVWAYNAWNRFDTSGPGNWGCGWATPFGTVYTPSLVGMREGLDDRRWLQTARRHFAKDPAALARLDDLLRQAQADRADTRYDSYNEAAHPEKMHQWRNQIMDMMTGK